MRSQRSVLAFDEVTTDTTTSSGDFVDLISLPVTFPRVEAETLKSWRPREPRGRSPRRGRCNFGQRLMASRSDPATRTVRPSPSLNLR